MQRYAACIEYCGCRYVGWQRQKNQLSVQEVVENAISHVADQTVSSVTAGRTDTGVHATGQVIHFDCDAVRTDYNWVRGINTHLPDDVSMVWIKPVDVGFHARFGAIRRRYRYVLLNRRVAPGWLNGLVSWSPLPLDLETMQSGAENLVGEHDFSAFRAAGCQSKQPVKTVCDLTLTRHGDFVCVDIEANGFLHHMVRNIVGSLIRVGEHLETADWIDAVLHSKDRKLAGVTAPPDGLYFARVTYAPEFDLPEPSPMPRFW
ncbi:MAG: tRNA pseudouridine(38-40) synthase TruA [Pseudomonadota bacterium]